MRDGVETVRWGVLATGKIAKAFCRDLLLVPGAELAAVGSRSAGSAQAFAAEYGGTAYSSYEALAEADVDVVYVASPHGLHHEHVRMLLEAGKPVLCEKSLTLDAAQAEDLVALATERGLFLMEAMWMACHPMIIDLRARLANGEFGAPRQLNAHLGFRVERPPSDRLLDPALGGGALLDMGVYPLTLAQLLLGEPEEVSVVGTVSDTGIDLDVAIAQRYAGGAVATLGTSLTSHLPRGAWLATEGGRLELDPQGFHRPAYVDWLPFADTTAHDHTDAEPIRLTPPEPVIGAGYSHEAVEVMRCLRAGLLESPLVPHEQTLGVLRQMDAIRARLGVVYPGEGVPPGVGDGAASA